MYTIVQLECSKENGRDNLLLLNESSHVPDSWTRHRVAASSCFPHRSSDWSGETAEFSPTPARFSNDLSFASTAESSWKQQRPGQRSRLSSIAIDRVPNCSLYNLHHMVCHFAPAAAIIRRQNVTVFGIHSRLHRLDDASIRANRAETAAVARRAALYTFRGGRRNPHAHFFFFSLSCQSDD